MGISCKSEERVEWLADRRTFSIRGETLVSEKSNVYIGDIVIILNKDKISNDSDRKILENGIPYTVESLGYSSGTYYIKILGKEIMMFESNYEYIEHIKIAKRYVFEVGDMVMINNTRRVEGAEESGFEEKVDYEVTRVIDRNDIVISNGKQELWIKEEEIPYVAASNKKPTYNTDQVVREIENENLNRLIDRALDERDFEELEKLAKKRSQISGK